MGDETNYFHTIFNKYMEKNVKKFSICTKKQQKNEEDVLSIIMV